MGAVELNVLSEVSKIVESTLKLPAGKLDVDAELESFGLDSIITMELMTNLSKKFDVSMTPAQFSDVNTVNELARTIQENLADVAVDTKEQADTQKDNAEVGKHKINQLDNAKINSPELIAAANFNTFNFNALQSNRLSHKSNRRFIKNEKSSKVSNQSYFENLLNYIKQKFSIDLSHQSFRTLDEVVEVLVSQHFEDLLSHYQLTEASLISGDNYTSRADSDFDQTLMHHFDVAIVGLSCRFPDAPDARTFWNNLVTEKNSIREIPKSRWDWEEHYAQEPTPGKTVTKWGALIEDVDCFDPSFFNLSADEAKVLDPQERLLLQQVYLGLEDAGIDAGRLRGSNTGVFIGYEYAEYEQYLRDHAGQIANAPLFNSSSPTYYLANRLSYLFDFCGPSESINTNCASSAVAINRAYYSLLNQESEVAVAGGVCLNLFVNDYITGSQYGMLSPDGTCGVFDDNANGFTRGEGVGVVVLKRLADAERDNNHIYGVIKACHQNNRGGANDLSEIKHEAITRVIGDCYDKAGINPETIDYIEVDGYSTKWGDSFEFEGIKNVFKGQKPGHKPNRHKHCALGSVKGNIGHLEPASGIASVIKVALSLKHRKFPATITKRQVSDFIDIKQKSHPLYIADREIEFEGIRGEQDRLIRAGVNSFADSGANVHIVLEEYVTSKQNNHLQQETAAVNQAQLFILSAKDRARLADYVDRYIDFLSAESGVEFADLIYSLQTGREAMTERLAVIATSADELLKKLTLIKDFNFLNGAGKASEFESRGIYHCDLNQAEKNPLVDSITEEMASQMVGESVQTAQWQQVALLWTNGVVVPWMEIWQGKSVQRTSLPAYPFAKQRYWLSSSDEQELDGPKISQQSPLNEIQNNTLNEEPFVETALTEEWVISADSNQSSQAVAMDSVEKIRLFLQQVVARQLDKKLNEIDIEQNYLELGMNSLGIADLIQQTNQLLQEKLSPSLVFKYMDIKKLSDYLVESFPEKVDGLTATKSKKLAIRQGERGAVTVESAPLTTVKKVNKKREEQCREFPLSIGEKGLYILQKLHPEMSAYNVPLCFKVSQKLNLEALAQAWLFLQKQFPILTARISEVDGVLYHQLDEQCETSFQKQTIELDIDLDDEQELLAFLQDRAKQSFDLNHGPLTRIELFALKDSRSKNNGKQKAPNDCYIILITIHHIIFDGASAEVLLRSLFTFYQQLCQGDKVFLQEGLAGYQSYVSWEESLINSNEGISHGEYWQQQLSGELPSFELFSETSKTQTTTFEGKTLIQELPAEIAQWVHQISQSQSVQPSAIFLAVFQLLLHKYTSQEDIIIGMPVMGRTEREFANEIGYFINMLPLRNNCSPSLKFKAFLRNVQSNMLDALYHSSYPFPLMLERLQLNQGEKNPVFQVSYAYHNFVPEADYSLFPHLEALEIETLNQVSQEGDFDLGLEISEDQESFSAYLKYNSDLYSQDSIQRLFENYCVLFKEIANSPDLNIGDYPIIDADEKRRLLIDNNQTKMSYPRKQCIHQLFAKQAKRHPDKIAAVFGQEKLSYQQLYKKSSKLALYLQGQGVKPDSLVGLCVERSLDMLVGMLGILQAGGAYVPLDPNYPEERLSYMLQDISQHNETSIVLTQEKLQDKLNKLVADETQLVDLDNWSTISHRVAELKKQSFKLRQTVKPDNLAYVIYTSGSTGQPKGVMVEHQSLQSLCAWHKKAFEVTEKSRATQVANIAFDAATWEIWPYLLHSASLVIVPNELSLDIEQLNQLIVDNEITHSFLVTPIAQQLLQQFDGKSQQAEQTKLEYLLIGGDKLSKYEDKNYPFTVVNNYGPTESTVVATSFPIEGNFPIQNIGRPIGNTQVYILDANHHPQPVGVAGELHIAGDGLARGYLNQPELTDEKFIDNVFNPGTRLYKTGDMARWLADGTIEYLGRVDTQVKIRGFRIEVGEIETQLNLYPEIKDSVVVVQEHNGNPQLVAFYLAIDSEMGDFTSVSTEKLKAHLQQTLPVYMVPATFAGLKAIPLTANGKVDRKSLEKRTVNIESTQVFSAATTEIEKQLVTIWGELLNLDSENIGVNDNFFELGGHSLIVTQLISMIRSELKIELPLKAVFEHGSIKALAQIISQCEEQATPAIIPVDRSKLESLPLSYAQERLWFIDQLESDNATYNIPGAVVLKGDIDINLIEQAFNLIIARHENLRTTFPVENGQAQQLIQEGFSFKLERADFSHCKARKTRHKKAIQLCQADAIKPFKLATGPLIRGIVIKLAAQEHVLMLNMHHIVSDGWSMVVLINEFELILNELSQYHPEQNKSISLPPLAIQYADYSAWQRNWLENEGVLKRQLAYWQEKLAGLPESLNLMTDFPRPGVQSFTGANLSFSFDSQLTKSLQQFSEKHSCTLYMTLLSAFKVLMYRYTGQEDICVGSPIANRQYGETEKLVGMFVNTLALRSQIKDQDTLADLVSKVKDTCLEAYENQDTPFEKIVDLLRPQRNMAMSPLFQVMFVLQNTDLDRTKRGEVEKQNLPFEIEDFSLDNEISQFDLTFEFAEVENGLSGSIQYCKALFKPETISRMVEHFTTLCQVLMNEPDTPIAALDYVGDSEKQGLLVDNNQTKMSYPRKQCIHQLFAKQAKRHPDKIAAVFGQEKLSYQQLYKKSSKLALYLQGQGVKPDSLVGLCVERSLDMLVGMLGILQAGGAYVPLDPNYPEERLSYMLQDISRHNETSIVLTQGKLQDKLNKLVADETQLVDLDNWSTISHRVAKLKKQSFKLRQTVKPDNLAYVIYTSGSTGQPKGVMVEHQSLQSLCAWHKKAFEVTEKSRATQVANIAFDAATWEIWPYLLHSASLVIVPNELSLDIGQLNQLIIDNEITHSFLVTPIAQQLLQQFDGKSQQAEQTKLQYLLIGGDKLSKYEDKNYPFTVVNNYGPTESTVVATSFPIEGDFPIQNIGRPIANTQVYILDANHHPQPVGVAGELHIAGDGLARGYLNQPELTDEKFIDNVFNPGTRLYKTGDMARWLVDGTIEYLGRVDTQVKIRGFRIEVGEIETQLNLYPEIKDSVVVVQEHNGNPQLVAFYLAIDSETGDFTSVSTEKLKAHLQQTLPVYMVPATFAGLKAIPLTANGKVDRSALEQMPISIASTNEYVAPSNEIEQQLTIICGQLLNLKSEKIGINDNFFELGGHSLLATQFISMIREQLAVDIPLKVLFDVNNLADIASVIKAIKAQTEQMIDIEKSNSDVIDSDTEFEEISL
ncbi:non-ribosomal peptide synthetase [Aliikangiella coralliicola]|uniref:Amino acid adenylation domain-containing protein n=1 Tax=Aliikangiella coralliicola TaxID=2592383 RepID=A0A545U967_9GAMM|nr:non-ribosomal peptide synthetase [Aliikangiella coralliicola]TQV86011.1 amino acid adenylation domain-containing protein [Aliikangiella coralliicola]